MTLKIETTVEIMNKSKSFFLKKTHNNKIDKSLANLIKNKGEKAQTQLELERWKITTDTEKSKIIIWDDFAQRWANKFQNLNEIDDFLWKYKLP